jgi:Mg/Co/Ni transporter MgtE
MASNKFKGLITKISRDFKNRLEVFSSIKDEEKRNVIMNLSRYVQYDIVSKLSDQGVVDLLQNLDTDEASDVVRLLPIKRQKEIVGQLNNTLKNSISSLLSFDQDTAMELININYIQVEHDDSIVSVAKQVKTHERRTGKLPVILVMDGHKLLGSLPGYSLGLAAPEDLAKRFVKKVKTIKENTSTNKILEIF